MGVLSTCGCMPTVFYRHLGSLSLPSASLPHLVLTLVEHSSSRMQYRRTTLRRPVGGIREHPPPLLHRIIPTIEHYYCARFQGLGHRSLRPTPICDSIAALGAIPGSLWWIHTPDRLPTVFGRSDKYHQSLALLLSLAFAGVSTNPQAHIHDRKKHNNEHINLIL